MKYVIKTEGMGCGHCISRVTAAMNALGAKIDKIELNYICVESNVEEAVIREAIEDLGFDVVSITRA